MMIDGELKDAIDVAGQLSGIASAMRGIQNSFTWLNIWMFFILVFKDCSGSSTIRRVVETIKMDGSK